ncbi:hypothetical protein [Eudoraea chungangensis]|uniref:hypothetical protein n=1 Tax=Eudoraea chungangensis TaxID=1481905 RepID=UPI0023EAFF78|nr:hypothetical protein [Eudoraea chungangensis]
MKIKNKYRQYLCTLLVVLLLLQSCQVYHKTSVNLEEALQAQLPVKIISKTQEKSVYKKIVFENQNYFGLDRKNGNIVKYPLEHEFIEKILIKDKTASTWLTIGIILIPSLVFTFLIGNNVVEKSINTSFL